MSQIIETIDVNVPVRTAYNQWTQFEEFPKFMEGVKEVKQIDDTTLHWVAEIGGQKREWDAKITEQTPDQKIAWYSIGEAEQGGVVTFHRLDDSVTRVTLQIDFNPEGITEKAGDALGIIERRIKGDMTRFKEFIESRGQETGAWRGEVDQNTTS
jgi:uncharacterized membrane protein